MNVIQTFLSAARDFAALPRLVRQRSYSTFCEDAMFFSVFKPGDRGFYVDVGATILNSDRILIGFTVRVGLDWQSSQILGLMKPFGY
jgi:hypothetical protein